MTIAELVFLEVAPPGMEPMVRKLKRQPGVDNPYAVAWARYNGEEGGPGSGVKGHTTGGRPHVWSDAFKKGGKTAAKIVKSIKKGFGNDAIPDPYENIYRRPAKQANSSGGLPQTLRGRKTETGYRCSDTTILKTLLKESVTKGAYRFSESNLMEVVAPVVAKNTESVAEGPVVRCVLITEGLGNRADMHYYGPECIQAAVPLFEGQPCFIDHQKRSDVQDQPERTVRDKCGYFKNVRAEQVDGRVGLVAELHYDLSETGKYAYDKACTAIHYKAEFPGSDKEYVGLSIAADGKLEERTMQVGDEVLDVKYVTEFTAVGSVDEVTSPARGGRFVAVLAR